MNRRIWPALAAFALTISLILASGCQFIETLQRPPGEEQTPAPLTTQTPATGTPAGTPPSPTFQVPTPSVTPGQALPSIADVVAKVKPSVVSINTVIQFGSAFLTPAAGSGWILSQDGLIVTNNHVVEGARTISVTLDDGRTLDVDLATVATDPIADLAVLKVSATGLPAAKIGDSSRMRVGDWVVAIGNSLGEGLRATQGIISRTDVALEVDQNTQLFGMLETDAAINPGNSGGPLVNLAGEVVGITSAKISEAEGTGFAISISEAITIIQELATKGFVSRAYLGINSATVDDFYVSRLDLKVAKGVVVTFVDPTSPAGKAGLQAGDVVVRFGSKAVSTSAELVRFIRSSAIGREVEIDIWRGAARMTVKAVMVERPRDL